MISRLAASRAVAALLAEATGLPVGRGHAPNGAQAPYYLLYSVDTSLSGAPFADLNEDALTVYQVTSVSGPDPTVLSSAGLEDQAEWMADKARQAFLLRDSVTGRWRYPLTVPGYRDMARTLDTEPGGTSDPADGIISYVQRFSIAWTPA
ncbi:hypothetical protein D0Z67_29065 (plasmid) [Streptomyces seoulensis]|uniref:DUF3168 domain-containing protein n=1 Tax=Streptomyces seoulensis TaxID=73044 RepID=A0A4P6U4S5_STRSO|nr:hypothetical protein [Streptomyces seoulensis]QBJ94423.1 hypothetical protein D0Z67_29065 [Streptomyces seoulensis]